MNYKRGDIHPETGLVFWAYGSERKDPAIWLTPEKVEQYRANVNRAVIAFQARRNPNMKHHRDDKRTSQEKYIARRYKEKRSWALKQGHQFAISLEEYSQIPTHCPVLGIPLILAPSENRGPRQDSASFDRIDNNFGYIPGNTIWVSFLVNRIKQSVSVQQLTEVAKFYSFLQKNGHPPSPEELMAYRV